MIDITFKSNTLRIAIAKALVNVSSIQTIELIEKKMVPKGDVFEISRAAGLFAVKRTSDVIPDCHPMPVEFTSVSYSIEGLSIEIHVEVHTVYKTGVEVEAMHGAALVALTMYDMLKPVDKNVSIGEISLVEKKGGKSDFIKKWEHDVNASVVVCSDSISEGKKLDSAGKAIMAILENYQIPVENYVVIPDEIIKIQETVTEFKNKGVKLIILTGGTGLSPRDVTPEAIIPLLEKRIDGIEEAIRNYGQQRTPYSMLSRSVCGLIGETLVLALPGSTRGAKESVQAVFPHILHIFRVIKGARHD